MQDLTNGGESVSSSEERTLVPCGWNIVREAKVCFSSQRTMTCAEKKYHLEYHPQDTVESAK